jgi:hypothetical protein
VNVSCTLSGEKFLSVAHLCATTAEEMVHEMMRAALIDKYFFDFLPQEWLNLALLFIIISFHL